MYGFEHDPSLRWFLRRQEPKDDTTLRCLWPFPVYEYLPPDQIGRSVAQVSLEDSVALEFWTYLLASQKNGTLYCGHTDDLVRRVFEHREGRGSAFTKEHRVHRLVWCEPHETREAAKVREYQIKK